MRRPDLCEAENVERIGTKGGWPFQIMIALLIIVNLLSMVICYQIAKSRKANRWYWLLVGFLIGPFAVPFVFFASPEQR